MRRAGSFVWRCRWSVQLCLYTQRVYFVPLALSIDWIEEEKQSVEKKLTRGPFPLNSLFFFEKRP